MLLINNLKLGLEEKDLSLKEKAARKYHIPLQDILSFRLHRKSLDARKDLHYVCSILIETKNEKRYLRYKDISLYETKDLTAEKVNSDVRPVIIGYGPSGIFSAWRLAEAGLRPIVFERGKRVAGREKDIDDFFKNGVFSPSSNVVYGEGGAGTFSDAKLTTRVNDPFIPYITDIFIRHGAPERIAWEAHPHIGTDAVRKVIASITDDLIKQGVEFHFEEGVTDFEIEDGTLKAVITDKGRYPSSFFLLGIGHSAYDTFRILYEKGVHMVPKDTAVGFRVEHPQSLLDENQYGKGFPSVLEASEYFLRYKDIRSVYSFCMCPGGYVVPSNAEEASIVTNGMSYEDRDNHLGNSAILIQVPKELYGEGTLAGFEYLKKLEERAYSLSSSYKALSMNIKDYLNGDLHPLIFPSSYPLGTVLYDLNSFFTEEENNIFKRALQNFDTKITGFIENGIMVAPETRASSPVRIPRLEDGRSENTAGLYPMGEGPGYGGGIMSCALDGIRTAERILNTLKQDFS